METDYLPLCNKSYFHVIPMKIVVIPLFVLDLYMCFVVLWEDKLIRIS